MKKRKKKKRKNNTKAQNNQAELKPGKNGKLKNNLKSITENFMEKIDDLCWDSRFILLMFFLLMEIMLIGVLVITDKIYDEVQEPAY